VAAHHRERQHGVDLRREVRVAPAIAADGEVVEEPARGLVAQEQVERRAEQRFALVVARCLREAEHDPRDLHPLAMLEVVRVEARAQLRRQRAGLCAAVKRVEPQVQTEVAGGQLSGVDVAQERVADPVEIEPVVVAGARRTCEADRDHQRVAK
jgi:hypothetical protein